MLVLVVVVVVVVLVVIVLVVVVVLRYLTFEGLCANTDSLVHSTCTGIGMALHVRF